MSCLAALLLGVAGLLLPAAVPAQGAAGETGAAAAPASAREEAWYTAEVPVTSQEARERSAALGRALAQVMVRVTGQPEAGSHPVVARALRSAESLLLASEYRETEELAGGVPVRRLLLAASFEPDAVDALAVAAGLPLWTGERPKPLLWLAIDDGSGAGPRLVSAQQLNVVRPLAQRGLERGLRLSLPAGTAVEQAAVSSLWKLDAAALAVLGGRYGARVQLLGKIARAPEGGWAAEWLLAEEGKELRRWNLVDPQPQRAIASGADPAADVLAARQATRVPTGQPEVLEAELLGLRSAEDWLGVAGYLQTLPVLRGFEVREAEGDRLRLRLDLAVDRARFEALLAAGRRLEVAAPGEDAEGRPLARYRVPR